MKQTVFLKILAFFLTVQMIITSELPVQLFASDMEKDVSTAQTVQAQEDNPEGTVSVTDPFFTGPDSDLGMEDSYLLSIDTELQEECSSSEVGHYAPLQAEIRRNT